MINYLLREEIDVVKYDHCISNATNARIYAYSWYLDHITDNWGALILKDYEAVMPLPYRRKYFVNYIYLPPWSQQLGVFSEKEIDPLVVSSFLKEIPKKFKFIELFLNTQNKFSGTSVSTRTNFILPLRSSIEQLRKNYAKGRKSDLNYATKQSIRLLRNSNADRIIELFKHEKGNKVTLSPDDYTKLKLVIHQLVKLNKIEIVTAFSKNDAFLGGAIFLIDTSRITYLFSAITSQGREQKVTTLILDNVIKSFANSDAVFDFEGSMISGLASFFKSFGAIEEDYYHFKKYRF